jgi:hypothetical protein
VICIDPGVKACGWAVFEGALLLEARYETPHWVCNKGCQRGEAVAIEMPRIYPGSGQQKGDLNDLLNLATVVGQVERACRFGSLERIYPSQWKGQVPKKIMTARILSKLTPVELSRIVRVGAKDHNTIDAIGIGLWKAGRL